MNAFDSKNLFDKAKLYVDRAMNEDRESELFPFWISLSLELLAKSALANVSPTLLADLGNRDSSNLLYALGYQTSTKPKSIQFNEVVDRLTKLNINFNQEEYKQALLIADQRNCELHSGIKGYVDYPISKWLSHYYRISKILLDSLNKTLVDLFGEHESKAAEIMLKREDTNTQKIVLDKIAAFGKVFNELTKEQKEKRVNDSNEEIRKNFFKSKIISCPSCGNKAILSGDLISYSDAKIESSKIRQERRYLPTNFACIACGLTLSSYQQIKHTDFSNQFVLEEYLDELDYFGIDPEEHVDIDYMVQEKIRQIKEDEMYEDFAMDIYRDMMNDR
jgi:hypothetical protein